MKRLTAGFINTISFVKHPLWVINDFDVTLEKVVGTGSLSLTGLQDLNALDTCKDFIRLNIDLLSNSLEGGEYYIEVTNGDITSSYLCDLKSHEYSSHGSDIYSDSVVLSTDVSAPEQSVDVRFQSERVKLFIADSLTDAQTVEPTLAYGTNVFASGTTHDLTALINGSKKLYVSSTQSGSYIYWAGTRISDNPNLATNIPFAANFPAPHYKTVDVVANEIKEIDAFGNDAMFPVLLGINGASVFIEAAITKLDYVKEGNYNATINAQYDATPFNYSRKPAWVNNSNYQTSTPGARVAFYAALINDDV